VAIAKALAQRPEFTFTGWTFLLTWINPERTTWGVVCSLILKSQKHKLPDATNDHEDVISFTDETIAMQHGKIVIIEKQRFYMANPTQICRLLMISTRFPSRLVWYSSWFVTAPRPIKKSANLDCASSQ
jgi:hypothetical protein